MKLFQKILISLVLLLPLPLILLGTGLLTPSVFGDTWYGELGEMYRNLQETEGKKIVIIGNSNVAFGIDSSLMEEELQNSGADYRVVSFGLYGTIGSAAMLDLAYDSLSEGDIAVFCPEPQTIAYSTYFNGKELWRSIDSCHALLGGVSRDHLENLFGSFLSYVQEKVTYLKKGENAPGSGVYARASFDENCVMRYADRTCNIMEGGYDPDTIICLDDSLPDEEFIAYLNAYAKKLEKKGVSFCFSFSPMNEPAVSAGASGSVFETAEEFRELLLEVLDFPVISDPSDYILDSGWFYDSNFHLNADGMTLRSLLLTDDLKDYLGISGENRTQIPEEPVPAQSTKMSEESVSSGKDPAESDPAAGEGPASEENVDCFLYEKTENGTVRIIGMTDKGSSLTGPVLPSSYDGLAVTSFSADTFAGNTVIRSLTIPSGITRLYDRSFYGCENLEEIILEETDPSRIAVGFSLLEGTDGVRIVVPAEAFPAYQNNYFWSYYGNGNLVRSEEAGSGAETERTEEAESAAETEEAESAAETEETGESLPEASAGDGSGESVSPEESFSSVLIRYEGNGGCLTGSGEDTFTENVDLSFHLRANTARGTEEFSRDGYTLTGWNTEPDGSGLHVGLGSRITAETEEMVLYAEWIPWSEEALFQYEETEDETVTLTAYTGPKEIDSLVLPSGINGKTVTRISEGFASEVKAARLVLPETIVSIEDLAFSSCEFTEIIFFDTLSEVSNESFADTEFETVRINAATAPRYQTGNDFCWFADLMDRLILEKDQKKLVVFGGCSVCYGLDSSLIDEHFNKEYAVFDMGINGGTNAVFQLACITEYLQEGDIFIHAPEVGSGYQLLYVTSAENRMFLMTEGNYDLLSLADMREIGDFFHTYSIYSRNRIQLPEGSYSDHCDSYNSYGDYAAHRIGHANNGLTDGYTYQTSFLTEGSMSRLCDTYRRILEKGAKVYVSFSPVNRDGLSAEDRNGKVWEEFEEILRTGLMEAGIPVISTAEEYLFPGNYFYDTDYHLTTDGAGIRTQLLLSDLDTVVFSKQLQ